MESAELALEITGLDYSYRHQWTGRLRQALFGLDLSLTAGECFGFLGHNGAGKTTTIKCILNLVRPQRGEIRIMGVPYTEPRAREAIGYLPEQPYFYDHLSVREILGLYGQLNGMRGRALDTRIEETLATVKLEGRAASPLRSLSKGLTQRLALAQAILAKPRLLILDEPFSGLDPIGRKEFRDILFDLKHNGTTIFMCSHILSDVEFLCDRVSIMAHGKIKGVFDLREAPELSAGSYELVVRHQKTIPLEELAKDGSMEPQDKFVRFTYDRRELAEAAMKRAIDLGLTIDSFQFVHASLEELFVQLVKFEEGR